MSVSVDPDKPNYVGLINESVHTSDDQDIGDIYAMNKFFLVVKRGFINIHYYYLPMEKVEGWDEHVLWLKIKENEVSKYERDVFPHPLRYYVKGFAYEGMPPPVSTVNQIPSKFKTYVEIRYSDKDTKVIDIYKCDLCEEVSSNEDNFKKHVSTNHI